MLHSDYDQLSSHHVVDNDEETPLSRPSYHVATSKRWKVAGQNLIRRLREERLEIHAKDRDKPDFLSGGMTSSHHRKEFTLPSRFLYRSDISKSHRDALKNRMEVAIRESLRAYSKNAKLKTSEELYNILLDTRAKLEEADESRKKTHVYYHHNLSSVTGFIERKDG